MNPQLTPRRTRELTKRRKLVQEMSATITLRYIQKFNPKNIFKVSRKSITFIVSGQYRYYQPNINFFQERLLNDVSKNQLLIIVLMWNYSFRVRI